MVAYSFHPRFVEPIRRGFVSPYPDQSGLHPKRQTIRADRRRHARPGEELQLYCGMRTKKCFLIGRTRCISISRIAIRWCPKREIFEDGKKLEGSEPEIFARADGFNSIIDMMLFWQKQHPGPEFDGVIIRWEPLP